MKRLVRRCLRIQVTVLFLIFCLSSSVFAVEADLIVYNGKIVTVDENFTIAQAVAIKDGKFIRVGEDAEVRSLAGPNTTEIDMQGKMADLVVLEKDILTCPLEEIKDTKVLTTMVAGKLVNEAI